MARCFDFKRSLDIKTLSNTNSSHEFQFQTLLEIKKEVEDDLLDMESETSPEAAATDFSGLDDDHDRELRSTDTSNQHKESHAEPHPKLVLNLRDLWRKAEQNMDFSKKRKQRKDRDSKHEILTIRKLRSNERRSTEDRITRSSLSTPNPSDCHRETKTTMDHLQQEAASDEEENQSVRISNHIPRSRKNLNLSCESCGMRFRNSRKLQAHQRYYTADGEYQCTICDVRFNRSFQLSRHVRNAHSSEGNEDTYKFKCNFCIERFERKATLIAHVIHLHNKHVVSHKKINSNKEVASLPNAFSRKNKHKERARKSKRSRKHVVPINSHDQQTLSDVNFNSTKDPAGTGANLYNEDKHLIHENSKMQRDDECQGNQLTVDILDCNNKEVNTSSTQDLTNMNDSNHIETLIQKESEEKEATAQQHIQKKHIQEGIDEAAVCLGTELSKKDATERENNHIQCIIQPVPEIGARNTQPLLEGDLVDHLGSKVGHWCVSESSIQSDNIDCVSDSGSVSATVDLAYNNPKIKMTSIPRCSSSSILQTTILHSSATIPVNTATYPDQKLTDVDAAIGCNDFDMNLSRDDDFGETYESTFVNCDDEEMSDGSCESISLKIAASPSNVSLANSLVLKSHNVTPLIGRDIPNDPRIRDVRVLLVKLEDMLNLTTKNRSPESSPLQNSRLGKSEIPHRNPCEKQSVGELALWQHSKRSNDSPKVSPNAKSRRIIRKKRVTTNNCPKVLSNRNKRKRTQGIRTGMEKHCYLCDEVFGNIFTAVSHYLSVHIKVGVLQCCLCSSNFSNSRRLRHHLCRHHTGYARKKLSKFCVDCKIEFIAPSLRRRCLECTRNSRIHKHNSAEEQFLNAQDLTEHQSTCTQVSKQVSVIENRSVSFSETSPLFISEKKKKHNTSMVDHESTRRADEVVFPQTCEKVSGNFKCLVCNCLFHNRNRLDHHLSTAHATLKYRKRGRYQDGAEARTLPRSTSRDCNHKVRKRRVKKNSFAKFSVGKKRTFKSEDNNSHDELCKRNLCVRRRLSFSQVNRKNQHLIRQHNIRDNKKTWYDHKCDVCRLNCCCRKSLKIHKRRYLTNGNHICNICGLTFARKQALVMHMKTAHNPKMLSSGRVRCEICNQGFFKRKFLRIHLAHFHNIKYFQCKICRIRFDTFRGLNSHRRNYSKNAISFCHICQESFKCKYMLEYHRVQVHNRDKLKAYKYFCDVCNCAFLDELLLQAHIGHFHYMQDHKGETNAITTDMGKAAKHLPKDIELPVKTEITSVDSTVLINNSTIQKVVNQVHHDPEVTEYVIGKTVRTHTPSEYKCGICKLSFNDPYAILNHEWELSNDGTHVCHVCNRKFVTSSLLNSHRIKHYQRNVIRKYECYVCLEDFSSLDDLKSHGLHLHGPQFAWEKSSKTADIHDKNTFDSRENRDRDVGLKKSSIDNTYDTIGLMASDEVSQNGKILLFRKIANKRTSGELLRRNSNEDAYCCNFCKTNFSSASFLDDHVKKHAYRAYCSNSSRYLCLICKNKFRTNDILRAHVIHSHTSDEKKPHVSELKCSKHSISDEAINSRTHSDIGQTDIDDKNNKTENTATNSSPEQMIPKSTSSISDEAINSRTHSDIRQTDIDDKNNKTENTATNSSPEQMISKSTVQNQPSFYIKRHIIQQSNDTSPSKKRRLYNSAKDVDIFQSDHGHRTLLICEDECTIKNDSKCNNSGAGDNKDRDDGKFVESSYSVNTSHIESDLMPEEVELFTVKVRDGKGLEKHACTICMIIFHSVAQFREHFASIHVENKVYLCTFCGEKFAVIADLKYHTLKHDREPKYNTCCDKEFLLTTDLVRHQLSHDAATEEKQNIPHTRLSPMFEGGSSKESEKESHLFETVKSCKCEICDTAFLDFNNLLTHWDSCIDTNGLQCDLCKATFKSLNSFRVHKMTHYDKTQNSNSAQNRRSLRVNGDRSIRASEQSSTVYDDKLKSKATVHKSVKVNSAEKLDSALYSTEILSNQNESVESAKITIKPFARILKISKNNNEWRFQKHGDNDANDTSKPPRPESGSTQGIQSLKEVCAPKIAQKHISIANVGKGIVAETKGNTSTRLPNIHYSAKSLTEGSQLDKQVSNNIASNANGNNLVYHLLLQDSNNINKQQPTLNDFSLRVRENEFKVQRIATSQATSSSAARSICSNHFTANSRINIDNTWNTPSGSGQRSHSNDYEAKRPSNLLSASSINADSVDSSSSTNSPIVPPSDVMRKSHPNDGSSTMPSSSAPMSLNRGISPTYLLSTKPTSDRSSRCTTPTILLKGSKLKSCPSESTAEKLRTLFPKTSSLVVNPMRASDIQRIANNSSINTKLYTTSNASSSRSHSKYNKDTRVTTVAATPGTSTDTNVLTSHKNATKVANISIDKSAPNKELILRQQVVRCSYCNLLFTEKAKLIKHMEIHKTGNQCPACGLNFSNERALQQHLPEHKSSTCTKCKMVFLFSDSIAHSMGTQNHCSVCQSLLPPPTRKLNRLATNSPRQLMKCGICMQTFATISQMTVHFKMVHSTFVCGICKSRFSTKTSLHNHMRAHGSDSLELVASNV